MKFKAHPERRLDHWLSAPIIYAMAVPLFFLDLCFEIYQRLCFPLYGIECVERARYIKLDRHKLKYLTNLEKLNCDYCSYANGLLAYATAIAGETEKYWCGIKHKKDPRFTQPLHHIGFAEYDDEVAYEKLSGK